MEWWREGVALVVHLLSIVSILFLCRPANRARIQGWHLFLTACVAATLGSILTDPPHVFAGDDVLLFPFDVRKGQGEFFGRYVVFENFAFGAGIPFIALAASLACTRRRPPAP